MENKLAALSKKDLLIECEKLNIKGCRSKTKPQLIELILTPLRISNAHGKRNLDLTKIDRNISLSDFTFIDLFCGIGGFHQALSKIGGKCVFACDIDTDCRKIYEKNYKMKIDGDITTVDVSKIPPFDVLCGGFPCQAFSKAGFQRGFEDKRGNLFFNICDIVKHHKPKYLLLENVKNLASHDDGNTWKVISENIQKLGYSTYSEPVVLNVLHFNIPQNRERVVILCKRNDLGEMPPLPSLPKNPKPLLTRFISDFIKPEDADFNKKYSIDGKMKAVEKIWNSFVDNLKKNRLAIPKYPIWTDWWDNDVAEDLEFYNKYKSWIDKNREFYTENRAVLQPWLEESRKQEHWVGAVRKFEWQAGDLSATDSMNTVLWTARASGIRVKKADYIPTLVAMNNTPIYGKESRKLSPRELLRLQSFPDTFQYDEKTIYKQLGNAVNVEMMERCARFLIHGERLV
jgi:DNA (cytosine-5)-methyltransferase 1